MVAREGGADDVSYILLDSPLVPRLDLSDCRTTHLPVLPEATPPPTGSPAPAVQEGKLRGQDPLGQLPSVKDKDTDLIMPRGHVQTEPYVREVRTLVVDMRDLNRPSTGSNNTTPHDHDLHDDDDICRGDLGEELPPSRATRRSGGVLKGGGEYISTGEHRPRPRVSFLLDAAPSQGQEGGAMQIRVYAKPPQGSDTDADLPEYQDTAEGSSQYQAPVNHPRHHALPNGLPPKRHRPMRSADRRPSPSAYLRQHIRHMQTEGRAHDSLMTSARFADGAHRTRRPLHDDVCPSPSSTPQLPAVASPAPGPGSARRVQLFSLRRKASADLAYSHRESRPSRRSFLLPASAGTRQVKGQVRFVEEEDPLGGREGREGREPEADSGGARGLGTYSVTEHPPRAASCKPPLPRTNVLSLPDSDHGSQGGHSGHSGQNGPPRIPSATSRLKVREWLSVDSVPSSSLHSRPRPSTVSSASTSSRLAPCSRVSSASHKASSDPGVLDLDNMDPVTLNLMARRAKGPSRYRYLAKLRSLNLNTPTPLH